VFEVGGVRERADAARNRAESESLSVLCHSAWHVTEADPSLVMAVRSRTDSVARTLLSDPSLGPLMTGVVEFVARRRPSPAISCSSVTTPPSSGGELPAALRGAWTAKVTHESLYVRGQGLTEHGLVGSWRLEVADGGLRITDPDGLDFGAALTVSGDLILLVIDRGTIDQGLGERWRFRWSVFHGRLTLTSVPGDGLQRGPTALVTQPFTHAP